MAQLKDLLVNGNTRCLGEVYADNFIGNLTGNASTATKLATDRKLTIGNTGKSVNGSEDVSWTLAEIGAAAASHGRHIPDACTIITDWNAATTNGWYMASSASNAPNNDSSTWYFGRVIAHNTNYVYQEVYQFTASTDAKAIPKYIRVKNNGIWGAWTNVTVAKAVPSNAVFTDTTYAAATQSANGLMSAADKKKLDGIAAGADKTTVDAGLSSTSTNPVQNKVVNDAINTRMARVNPFFSGTMIRVGTTYSSNTDFVCFGVNSEVSGNYSFVEGYKNKVYGVNSHAEGANNTVSQHYSHAEGTDNSVSGNYSHAEGTNNSVSGNYSHGEGACNIVSGHYSHAEGFMTEALGVVSHTAGYYTQAYDYQFAIGHYNSASSAYSSTCSGSSSGSSFIIGNGTPASRSNAFRVTDAGATYAKAAYNSTGADYAEFFEWADENTNNEDRRGYFVTISDKKIKIADENDYILGIVSGQPSIIGNSDEEWMGRYVVDEFGSFITEVVEYNEERVDEETGETITVPVKYTKYKENPDYDSSRLYEQRMDRKEWAAVGLLGVLSLRDDGSCKVNGFCKPTHGGIATSSEYDINSYRVIERVSENVIKVVLK